MKAEIKIEFEYKMDIKVLLYGVLAELERIDEADFDDIKIEIVNKCGKANVKILKSNASP